LDVEAPWVPVAPVVTVAVTSGRYDLFGADRVVEEELMTDVVVLQVVGD
jgi:hypothetical protein